MAVTQAGREEKPISWAGVGTYPADMNNREVLCFGMRTGTELVIEKAFRLVGWKPTSLVDSLLSGPNGGVTLEKIEDLTGINPMNTFDLPSGIGFGKVLLAFQKAACGAGSVLEQIAVSQVAFHLVPELFERIWRELSGGNPALIRHYLPVTAERAMVAQGTAWRKSARIAYAAALEEQLGARKQLFGHRVLDAALGSCPECGSSMIEVDGQKMCELEALKSRIQPTPTEDVSHYLAQALAKELGEDPQIADDLYEGFDVTWDETV